jgi:phosphohistidine phosphatase
VKTLIILRHGKAEAHNAGLADHARGLVPRGVTASAAMGAYLAQHGPKPDLVLTSDARRACETMEAAVSMLGADPKIETEPELYLAGPDTILRRLRKIEDRFGIVMIVGHNPGFHDLARDLVKPPASGAAADRFPRLVAKFPTAAMAVLNFGIESWAYADYGTARLDAFLSPRDLEAI